MSNLGQGIWERGVERGLEIAKEKNIHCMDAIRLHKRGMDVTFIAEMLDEPVERVEEWISLVHA